MTKRIIDVNVMNDEVINRTTKLVIEEVMEYLYPLLTDPLFNMTDFMEDTTVNGRSLADFVDYADSNDMNEVMSIKHNIENEIWDLSMHAYAEYKLGDIDDNKFIVIYGKAVSEVVNSNNNEIYDKFTFNVDFLEEYLDR